MSVEVIDELQKEEILEIAYFFYEGYPDFKRMFPRWRAISLIDRNQDKVAFIKEDGILVGVAFYFKLEDNTLKGVEHGFISLEDPELIAQLLEQNGRNIHFLGVLADSGRIVLKGLRGVIKKENPKTVSWFKPDMKEVHFIKLRS